MTSPSTAANVWGFILTIRANVSATASPSEKRQKMIGQPQRGAGIGRSFQNAIDQAKPQRI
jgi:hypothetical protein